MTPFIDIGLSENQTKVLKPLQDDPRTSMRSLAEKADVSTPTNSNIVDELERWVSLILCSVFAKTLLISATIIRLTWQ